MNHTKPLPAAAKQLLEKAMRLHRAGQLLEAEQSYKALLKTQPHLTDARHGLGIALLQQKKADEASAFLQAAFEEKPSHAPYRLSYIESLLQQKNIHAAHELLAEGITQDVLTGDRTAALLQRIKALLAKAIHLNDIWVMQGASHGQSQRAIRFELMLTLPEAVGLGSASVTRQSLGSDMSGYAGANPTYAALLLELGNALGIAVEAPTFENADAELSLLDTARRMSVLLLQTLGHPVFSEGSVKPLAQAHQYELCIPWFNVNATIHTVQWVCSTLNQYLSTHAPIEFGDDFAALIENLREHAPIPNTLEFLKAAHAQDIPWLHLGGNLFQLGWGKNSQRIDSSFTGLTPVLATNAATSKIFTAELLRQTGLPVPEHELVHNPDDAIETAETLGFPVAVKPMDLEQGIGVSAGLTNAYAVGKAFEKAFEHSDSILVEKHVDGDDYRLLVVGGKLLDAVKRIPAGVVGDGHHTVAELLAALNADPRRGTHLRSILRRVDLDEEALDLLAEQGFAPDSVPHAGQGVRLRRSCNVSTGGTVENVFDRIHPDNRALAERAARMVGLDIAGVDFITPDIEHSWHEAGGAICEINAQPGFRPHWLSNPERNINAEIVSWLMKGANGRIPVVAVTGSNGKSTTTRMVHRILLAHGLYSGITTSQGVWSGPDLISRDDLSGFPGGRMLLTDPMVEAAVIELPRQGLIKFGFPFDFADVAALVNVQDDHLGSYNINSLEEMAALKLTVLQRARKAVVLNADDGLSLAQRDALIGPEIILYSAHENQPGLVAHLKAGGRGVFKQGTGVDAVLCLAQGNTREVLMKVADIPATENGLVEVNVFNALAATALVWGLDIPQTAIRTGLSAFSNTVEFNPGRYNWLDGFPCRTLLDNAHNPDGVKHACGFISKLEIQGRKILVIEGLGNRHFSHIESATPVIASTFDEVFFSYNPKSLLKNKDMEGRPFSYAAEFFTECMLKAGFPAQNIHTYDRHEDAFMAGYAMAKDSDVLVYLTKPWNLLDWKKALDSHGFS